MAEERIQRRLAAILAADVVGYSRLMNADEAGTLVRLKSIRAEVFDPKIAAFGGRVFKNTGDGALAEFSSAVDAVQCAVNIQKALTARQEGTLEDQPLVLRIGISQGDVIVEGDDLFGNGVNVAARMEGLAESGGICISGNVREHIGNSLDVILEDMGDQSVKNLDRPVRCFRVQLAPKAAATPTETPPPLPDKPSIAVLPFENMSGDPEQEYFADGIAEDIITALSRFAWFFVIARNSSFVFKGTAVDIKHVASELGVQYVLEGSVRKAGNRVRITAQLIDAPTGRHVWAERYDRELDDIFAVQDEITSAVTAAVGPEFVTAEQRRTERKAPENFDSWDCAMRGNFHLWRMTEKDLELAQDLFERAIELDAKSTLALTGLALLHTWRSTSGWTDDAQKEHSTAFDYAQRALASDPNDAWAYAISGYIHMLRRQSEAAVRSLKKALELNPNLAFAEGILGLTFATSGPLDEAVTHVAKADRLSPRDPARVIWQTTYTWSAFINGDYETAIQNCHSIIENIPTYPTPWRHLAAVLAHAGRLDEARAAVDQLLRISPGSTVGLTIRTAPFSNPEYLELFVEGLRKAGLPE